MKDASATSRSQAVEIAQRRVNMRKYKNWVIGWLFVLPIATVLLLMVVYPFYQVFRFSVSDVRLIGFHTTFIGLDNFRFVMAMPQLGQILLQTFIWTVASLALRIVIGFAAALLLDSGIRAKTFFRLATLIPWVVPSIVVANIWRMMYNPEIGLLSMILRRILPNLNIVFLRDVPLGSAIAAHVWAGFPFIMLMVMAGLQGIPNDYKEAARIDGANAIQLFWHIILPNLKSILMIIVVLELIVGFNAFDLIFIMTGGGPGIQTTILGIMIYNLAFISRNFGASSAASVILLGIVVVFFLLYVPVMAAGGGRKKED